MLYVVLLSRQCPSCTLLCVMSSQIVCHIGHRADRIYEWKAAWNNWPLNCKSLDQRRLSFSYFMNQKPRNISDHMSSENVTHFDICSVHARTRMHTSKSSCTARHIYIYIYIYIYIWHWLCKSYKFHMGYVPNFLYRVRTVSCVIKWLHIRTVCFACSCMF